jgi:HAD superfamily hydrolase (TIGR01509 family)
VISSVAGSAPVEAPTVREDLGASFVLPGRYAAVVFDMDGLLLDSEPLWVEAEAELLVRHGGVLTEADRIATHGRSIEESVETYAARLGVPDPDALRAELIWLMERRYLAGVPLRPGARDLVLALHGRVPMAVASNTTGALVRLALRGARLFDALSVVASGHDLGQPKPAPDVYLEACRRLGVAPADAIAFEDSPMGVRAAKAAGLFAVGVPERPDVDLAEAGADVVLASLHQVAVEPA